MKKILIILITYITGCNLYPGTKPENGNWYSIKGDNDTWLSYDKESKSFILKPAAFKSRFKAIKKDDNQFVFQLGDKEYLSASEDNTVTIRENPWNWETFTVEEAPNQKYYLRSYHGNYLRVNYHIDKLDLSPNREWWEAIEFIKVAPKLINQEQFYIEGLDGKFLSFDADSKKIIPREADKKTAFTIIAKPNNKIILQLFPGQYLSASGDGTVTIRENPWDWETFTLEDAPNQRYYLRSSHDNYLRINYHTNQIDLSPNLGEWEALKFIDQHEISPELKKLMSEPLNIDIKDDPLRAITLNAPFSQGAEGRSGYPQSTVIRDYRPQSDYLGLLHVKLDEQFEKNLPEAIKDQLKIHNLYQNNKVDIFL